MGNLLPVIREWNTCTLCEIGKIAHKHVFYDTIPSRPAEFADIVFIGEGPGMGEDYVGLPFVGVAGKLLRSCIEDALNPLMLNITVPEGYRDLQITLLNLTCCRPTDRLGGDNRQPTQDEIANCAPRLMQSIRVLRPTMVVCLGKLAEMNVPKIVTEIGKYDCTYYFLRHPSYILRAHPAAQIGYREELAHIFTDMYTILLSGVTTV